MKLRPRPKITSEDFVCKWQSWVLITGNQLDSQYSVNLLTKMIISQLMSQNTEKSVALSLTQKVLLSWANEIDGLPHTQLEVYDVLIAKLNQLIE